MADYVFQADPNFNRVILEDIEKNKENVFENVVNFINNLKGMGTDLNQKKFLN